MNCRLCGGKTEPLFSKRGINGADYAIHRCHDCTVWQIVPMPTSEELSRLYQSEYFHQRSDRGYADYTSEKIYRSVTATLAKNLQDLAFYEWEKTLPKPPKLLEVGCAAGHAVNYFAVRGWQTIGIDVAREMVEAGRTVGRNLVCADFLTHNFGTLRFDLVAHWATLEHLPEAESFLRRMRALLAPGGKIYLSTCNTGYFARRYGTAWRYLNVPEHVFYFNLKSLSELAQKCDLRLTRAFTYGSGYTTREGAGWFYRLSKSIADRAAKFFLSGDMIVIELTAHTERAPAGAALAQQIS